MWHPVANVLVVAEPTTVLVQGDDPKLVADGLLAAVAALAGDLDHDEVVHELAGDEYDISAIVDGVNTPPFLTDRRIVVARGIERFSADDLKQLVQPVSDPLPGVFLVLERLTSRTRVPKALTDAIKASGGEVRSTTVSERGSGRSDFLASRLDTFGVRLNRGALSRLADHLGGEVARVDGILEVLVSTYGRDRVLDVVDIEPYLGEQGGIPPWELTDPIDAGDVTAALVALERMMATGMHPLQITAILHRHVEQALRLDGSGARDDKSAAEVLGLTGSTFPAKKALARSRKIGAEVLWDHLGLLAAADLDLKGRSGLDGEAIMDVLVARLADPRRRRRAS